MVRNGADHCGLLRFSADWCGWGGRREPGSDGELAFVDRLRRMDRMKDEAARGTLFEGFDESGD